MDLDRIKTLIDALVASDLNEMEFSEDGWSLRLVRRAQPNDMVRAPVNTVPSAHSRQRPTRAAPDVAPERVANVAAPLFGIVHLQPAPDAPVFVSVGQAVTAGTPLCVIEAMKMFHEVRAEHDGTVSAILVASGQEVEAGQELIRFA
ncbi:acetyl-CoA carboxylase biotin carboxyl carrier protein subunit [Bradyrhizobium sp. BR 10261]|uniref:acetyl-CoA carboxylase biotin carboxyl carrier protein n=1 Tax=Bradyrhizobium sp. BR 10261 TaxID=2749992 RepID=UPI001C6499A0|nr:acetyl-CoA carboxylase biotin carboxyl carrier protein subunit [Bradyrhizobium sp. BR 10261]MBW7965083.1 acetyl-CoA carboxylase biotin carboxyl carrier protein subunit [Bradyrhizobium sp. BR 10261]